MGSAWHILDPEAMYWAPKLVQSLWDAPSIFITENRCAAADVLADDGRLYDTDRLIFLRAMLGQLQRASSEGVPVDGYFNGARRTTSSGSTATATGSGSSTSTSTHCSAHPSSAPNGFKEAAKQNRVV